MLNLMQSPYNLTSFSFHRAALLPQLVPFAGASSYVVHTYAASAVERLLLLRDKVRNVFSWTKSRLTLAAV